MPKIGATLADISTVIKPIDAGSYPAEITDVEHTESKKSHVPMVAVTYTLGGDSEFKGRKITDYFTLQTTKGEPNEAGLRGLKRLIVAACGEDRANDPDFDTDELQGQPVELVIKQEQYEDEDSGETQISSKVKKVLAAA